MHGLRFFNCNKVLATILGVLAVSLVIPFFDSYGDESDPNWRPYPNKDPSLPVVNLQLILRDANDNLVAYSEPSTVYLADIKLIHEFLDTKQGFEFEHKGKNYEIIEYGGCSKFHGEPRQFATYQQGFKGKGILIWRHDGYLAGEGDQYCAFVKIIRDLDLSPNRLS